MPKVSVIIPTYNRQQLIGRAIRSVLNQTFQDFEIVVIDDGSTDGTKDFITAYKDKVKYFYQEHKGISTARNRGIVESKGEYVAFLDSDDEWVPEKLSIQVKILNENPRVGIVHNKLIILNERGERVGTKPKKDSGTNLQQLISEGGDFPTSSILTRSECFKKAGLFDESLPTMEDFEMWLRIAKHYDVYEFKDKCLAFSHWHEGQITKDRIKVFYGLVLLDKRILNEFSNIEERIIIKRMTKNQYILSRAYYDKGQYRLAFRNLVEAMTTNPWVGLSLAEKTDEWYIKLIKLLKTYAYFLVSAFRSVVSYEKNSLYRV